MLRGEALAELELEEGATGAEIEGAYRDLAKAWHPDRFGSDERLRLQAEERLQRINEAYRALEPGDLEPEEPAPQARAVGKTREKRKKSILSGWGYVWAAGLMGALAVYVTVQNNRTAQQAAATKHATAATAPAPPAASAPAPAGPQAPAALVPTDTGRAVPGSAPDLSGLTAGERTSLEHVCGSARQRGEPEFNRCAAAQIATLAAKPERTDLAQKLEQLSAQDRSAMERACSSARDHDGPAAYDRCAAEFEKTQAAQH